ncbi:MAG: hypothetical protein HKN71_13710 [Gemmatimonadetes bacterium]|nr:hypothetical protein [Gemmatimonadota bacterium]
MSLRLPTLALVIAGALTALVPRPNAAQEPDAPLPQAFVEGVLEFLNDPATTRLNGFVRIAPAQRLEGAVGAVGGDLVVAGTVVGDIVLLNGDLTVEPGGRIVGDVLVVGGHVVEAAEGSIDGEVQVFAERLRVVTRADQVELTPVTAASRSGLYIGGARITVRAGTNYNRVEGLPVLFGPVFRTSSRNPLQVEALGIWRTEHDQTRDDLGFRFRVEQTFGPATSRLALGAGAYSQVTPIEAWGVGDMEASLASFLLHVDYRDYFEERGWHAWARAQIPRTPAELRLEFRSRDITSLPTGSPWTLRRNDQPWRAQPLVPEGDLETLTASLVWDERNDPEDATDGWYLSGRITRGLSGSPLNPPAVDDAGDPLAEPTPADATFTTGFLEFRRHARLSPDQDLALRVVAGGTIDGELQPAWYQHTLGGEGSLPGFRLNELDCGARDELLQTVHRGTSELEPVYARYGCGRIALFQLQYRSRAGLGFLDRNAGVQTVGNSGWLDAIDWNPSWLIFFDAGRGWSQSGQAPDEPAVADIGAGITVAGLGAYWAYPLSGDDRRANFYLRLQRRF